MLRNCWRFFLNAVALVALSSSTQANASDFIFSNGFESNTLCAWSPKCPVDSVLNALEGASTVGENKAALRAALELTIGSVPPEIASAVDSAAEFVTQFPATKGGFLSIGQAHEVATMSLSSSPSLSDALAALTGDVTQAYSNPLAPDSARIILMFSATSTLTSPLPLSSSTKLTLVGSLSYAAWLVAKFPSAIAAPIVDLNSGECSSEVMENQVAASLQVVLRNSAVVIYRIASAILNTAEAIVNCGSGTATEVAGVVLDAAESCVINQVVSWVEVDADTDCIGNVTGPPSAAACIAGLVPCLGDIYSVLNGAVGVAQAVENMVNGVCTVVDSREGLYAACDAGCPQCSELEVEKPCGFGDIAACFDPIGSVPTVSCVESTSPGCNSFGVPEITDIEGSRIIPDGGTVLNQLFFKDENAGINWLSSTVLTDTCGGCWSSNGWDPGVSSSTSGSFYFQWWCYCGSSQNFQATYQFVLYDSQGNTSLPFTEQVICSCDGYGGYSPVFSSPTGGVRFNP